MTSVILNRRTLLSGGTLLGLGALLAACGQQAANEASASAAPSETASATPSEMTSASASTAASDASSASATPSPVITRGYSGGSKAPDGEYRGADPNGPAQNVPKPASPEDGYREKSNEGLRKTLNAWIEWNNYGTQTGDYSQARKFVDGSFTELLDSYEGLEALYKRGGWIIAGLDHYIADGNPWIEGRLTSGRRTGSGVTLCTLNLTVIGSLMRMIERMTTRGSSRSSTPLKVGRLSILNK